MKELHKNNITFDEKKFKFHFLSNNSLLLRYFQLLNTVLNKRKPTGELKTLKSSFYLNSGFLNAS